MSRAERLLELMQLLRRHHYPVSGESLANELSISLRTLYRDIASLKTQGAHIDGEPGMGYVLRPGFMLPPLMFSEEEIEALVLGSKWVAGRADPELAEAAKSLLVKVSAVLPPDLRREIDASAVLVGPGERFEFTDTHLLTVRRAIREQRKIEVQYRDLKGQQTERVLWPFAMVFFDRARLLLAWCELRDDFRSFRCDRIVAVRARRVAYPTSRQILLKRWRDEVGSGHKKTTDRN